MADLSTGADAEGGERFGNCEYNDLKNHWRSPDPCGTLTDLQPGMIVSDENDDRLYVVSLISGCGCSEILQACVPLSDDVYHGYGHGWEGIVGYDELTNDALILGIPIGGTHRGLIICDSDDVVPNVAAVIGAITQPSAFFLDVDINGYLGVGHQADDRPGMWSGPDDSHPLAIQYEAIADVTFFENSGVGENRDFSIWGYITEKAGGAGPLAGVFRMEDANNEFVIEAQNDTGHEGITINLLETNQRFRIRQNAGIISMHLDGTDAFVKWSDGNLNLITNEAVNTNTIVNVRGKGIGYGNIYIYNQADTEFLVLSIQGGTGEIRTAGPAAGVLRFQPNVTQDVECWGAVLAGNPYFFIYGWITAGGARRRGSIHMDDINDEFEIEAENNVNHEGITVLIQEANQKFRVRGAARALRFYVKSDGEIGTNQLETGPTGGWTEDFISHRLPIYDENQYFVGYIPIYHNLG